jgi:hypothetical protein
MSKLFTYCKEIKIEKCTLFSYPYKKSNRKTREKMVPKPHFFQAPEAGKQDRPAKQIKDGLECQWHADVKMDSFTVAREKNHRLLTVYIQNLGNLWLTDIESWLFQVSEVTNASAESQHPAGLYGRSQDKPSVPKETIPKWHK